MISAEEFVERLCMLGARRGPRRFPRKRRDRDILMKSVVMLMSSSAVYTEQEIGKLLDLWLREVAPEIDIDPVSLRRNLVDYGQLERTRDGRKYRVGFPPAQTAFDLEVDRIDVRATIAAFREQQERRRAERRAKHAPQDA